MSALRLALAAVLAAAVMLGLAAPARAGCITRLPARVTLPDGPYAAAYTRRIDVRVEPRGRRVTNLRAELYTFTGQRLAVSATRRAARGAVTLSLRLDRGFRPLQAGAFTLVLTGEPNASPSCGPKQMTRVVRFRACSETLPITFGTLPGGTAADYGGWLSVPVNSAGGVIRKLTSAVYGFDGSLLGRAQKLPALFGERTLDHKLLRTLTPGRYTVVVEGLIAEQPASCGRKRAQAELSFL